jgi:cell division protein FtsL
MARLNIVLLALVVACALAVVTAQHRARLAFVAVEAAQEAAKKLDEEWTQLQLEQSTWARNKRVESIAAARLGMRLPDASNTVVVTIGQGQATQAAPAGEATR